MFSKILPRTPLVLAVIIGVGLIGCGVTDSVSQVSASDDGIAAFVCAADDMAIDVHNIIDEPTLRAAAQIYQERVPQTEDFVSEASLDDLIAAHHCLSEKSKTLMQTVDALPEADLFAVKDEIAAMMRGLFGLSRAVSGTLKVKIEALSLEDLMARPPLLQFLGQETVRLPWSSFVAFMRQPGAKPVETLEPLKSHAWLRAPEDNPYGIVETMLPGIHSATTPEGQQWLTELAVYLLYKNGYTLSQRFKSAKLSDLTGTWERLTRRDQDELEAGYFGSRRRRLTEIETQIRAFRSLPELSVENAAKRLAEGLNAKGLSGDSWVAEGISKARAVFAEGYPYGAWLIKEGDILAKPVSQGAADIFHALIEVDSHIGHASMITAFQQGEDRLYAHSEVMDGFEERDVMAGANDSLLYRPNFPLPPLFTEQAVDRLLDKGKVLYDARYMEGIEDEDGQISLYCTEFIHFIFLNGFDAEAPATASPFDGVKLDYTSNNSNVEQNIRRLGMWREQNYFVPDSLLYSPGLDFVGADLRFRTRSPSEAELLRLKQKLRGRFNSEAQTHLQTSIIKPMGFVERNLIGLLVKVASFKGKTSAIDKFSLPRGDERYYFLKFAKLYLDMDSFLSTIPMRRGEESLEVWEEQIEREFEKEILRDLAKYFQQNS